MARSRSPRTTRFSKAAPPTLKAWVLCRVGASKWRDAVPALVSRVVAAEEGLKRSGRGVTVNVLAPNVLALQHSFGGGAYKELRDLPLQDVRPYHGSDLQKLRDALLSAFRQQARTKAASMGPLLEDDKAHLEEEVIPAEVPLPAVEDDKGSLEEEVIPAEAPPPLDVTFNVATSDVTFAAPAALGSFEEPEPVNLQQLEEPARRRTEDRAQAEEPSQAERPASRVQAPVDEPQPPPTPEPSMPRTVGAPITPDCPVPKPPVRATAAVREEKAAVGSAMTKQRLRALTAVVAKAFQAARETTLTKEELRANAFVSEAKVSAVELDEALDRMNASGKIFLSSDLVFLL